MALKLSNNIIDFPSFSIHVRHYWVFSLLLFVLVNSSKMSE